MTWAEQGVVAFLLFGGLQQAMEGMPQQAMMALVSNLNVPLQGIARLTRDEPMGLATDTCFLEHPFCGTSWPPFSCDCGKWPNFMSAQPPLASTDPD